MSAMSAWIVLGILGGALIGGAVGIAHPGWKTRKYILVIAMWVLGTIFIAMWAQH